MYIGGVYIVSASEMKRGEVGLVSFSQAHVLRGPPISVNSQKHCPRRIMLLSSRAPLSRLPPLSNTTTTTTPLLPFRIQPPSQRPHGATPHVLRTAAAPTRQTHTDRRVDEMALREQVQTLEEPLPRAAVAVVGV